MNIIEKFSDLTEITEDMLLPEEVNHYELWDSYTKEDPGAICGAFKDFVSDDEIRVKNSYLYSGMGALNFLTPWGKVLDVGAGLGSLRLLLTQYHEYTPCDVFPHMKESVLVSGNGDLPFEDESFDYIYCSNVMQHLHRKVKQRYIEEFTRIIKPSGKVFICLSLDDMEFGPRFNNHRYAVTENYFVELESSEFMNNVFSLNKLSIITTSKRFDDMTSFWLCKDVRRNE